MTGLLSAYAAKLYLIQEDLIYFPTKTNKSNDIGMQDPAQSNIQFEDITI